MLCLLHVMLHFFKFVLQLNERQRSLSGTSGDIIISAIYQSIADTVPFSIYTALRLDVRQDALGLVLIHCPYLHIFVEFCPQGLYLHPFLVEAQQYPFCVQLATVERAAFPTHGW